MSRIYNFRKFVSTAIHPDKGPDGSRIIEGPKFRVMETGVVGYNLPKQFEGDRGVYPIPFGTELTLLDCKEPVGEGVFRWPPFDTANSTGFIYVDVKDLKHISGNFGIRG